MVLSLQSLASASVIPSDIELAHRISAAVRELGHRTHADLDGGDSRSVQIVEIAIDALDITGIRPFWKAVMGCADEPGASGPKDPLVGPVSQSPAIWFQQMAEPRPQRNRIHFDVSVPHDEARRRIQAALDAGGVLVSDAQAPAFWVLADAEGNEVCVTTWQGRDNQQPGLAQCAAPASPRLGQLGRAPLGGRRGGRRHDRPDVTVWRLVQVDDHGGVVARPAALARLPVHPCRPHTAGHGG